MKRKFIILNLVAVLALGVPFVVNAEGSVDTTAYTQAAPVSNIQSKKILISKVTSDPETIIPGQTFTLKFKLENNSNNRLENVSLKVVGIEGKNLLTGFSPVGTTNEIYGGTIAKKGSKELSIKLISDPSLKVGIYNFQISVTYNAPNRAQEEVSKVVGVVVKNAPNLTINSLTDESRNISASFVNAGKGPLNNVLATFRVNDKTYSKYYGTLDAEVEDSFEETIDSVSQDSKGVFELSYIDEMGTAGKVTKEIDIKSSNNENQDDSSKEEGKNSFWSIIKRLFGLGG